jgi:starch phosphorylase
MVAYFTMEVALDDALPLYSGGLGVLAGDYLRSAADLRMPLVAVSLLYRRGYFRQSLDAAGRQSEAEVEWRPEELATRLEEEVEVEIGGRPVQLAAWRVQVAGVTGGVVPLLLLDSDLPANHPEDRSITDHLYGGDERYRIRQEAALGLGGIALLRVLGADVATYHMNEGHSALLALALLEQLGGDVSAVRERCVFTTHTPVPAGHDRFAAQLVTAELGPARAKELAEFGLATAAGLDMTALALSASHTANAVSRRHGDVAQLMYPGRTIEAVTNGVHAGRWVAPPVRRLLDGHLPGWQSENALLRCATTIPAAELAAAHAESRQLLFAEVERRSGIRLDPAGFTIGAARRVTPYKRTTLLFSDLDRLRAIAGKAGPIHVVCSGKSHPRDAPGKLLLEELAAAASALRGEVEVVLLENYDLELAKLMCAGSDVWLNVPVPPNEASGTSGMKAALNGVPSLSTLDGWWIEGWIEGVTGWAVGSGGTGADDGEALYDKLEGVVLPLFRDDPAGFAEVRLGALALNGSFFNTERMAGEYGRVCYGWS